MIDKVIKNNKKITKPKRLVLISDTHITRSGPDFNLHVFNLGMEKINKIKNVSLYLHLGDLTMSGTLLDYEFALEQMKKFNPISGAPIKFIIGNHDALNVGYLLFEEMIGDRHFEHEDETFYIIGIDSTKPDLPSGIIHHDTIATVKNLLVQPEIEDKIKITCFHHQLIPIPFTGKERSAIDDSGNMIQMLIDTNSDLVINGHRHVSNLYTTSSSIKDLYIFNVGTFSCYKTRYRELFTYCIIDMEGNKLRFRILPILEPTNKKEILRQVNYYDLNHISSNEKPKFRFIQISNSMISTEKERKTSLDKAIETINKLEEVDLVIHAGNLTKNSLEKEFQLARKKLDALKVPFIVVPGYLDSKPLSWEHWQEYIGSLNPLFETDTMYFQGINSTTSDSKLGFIGRKRLHQVIDRVLHLNSEKFVGVCCFHDLIPTPLSVWRTELIDSGDALSQFAHSPINLVLNSSPSISFNLKIENTIFSNGGNLKGEHFNEVITEIDIHEEGLVIIKDHDLKSKRINIIGKYHLNLSHEEGLN